jgi:uncharacterized MAPEG superfamily protein
MFKKYFLAAQSLIFLLDAPIAAVNKAALLFLGLRAAYVGAYVSGKFNSPSGRRI